MLYSSCTDVAEPMNPNGLGQPVEELREQARQEALAAWEKFKADNNLEYREGGSSSGGGSTTRDPIPCECTYVIEEVNYQFPDGQTDLTMDFFSVVNCSPSTLGCYLFDANYFSDANCTVSAQCGPTWSTLPPTGHQPFNCLVPPFQTFPIWNFASYTTPSCGGGTLVSWSIKFKIYCQQTEQDPNCLIGQGYGFVSELITLSSQGGTNDNVVIQLQDCGCKPVLIE
jgi:hypothetical protein